jgi:hypothetical protein
VRMDVTTDPTGATHPRQVVLGSCVLKQHAVFTDDPADDAART